MCSEQVDLSAVLTREVLVFSEIMGSGHRNHADVMVVDQLSTLLSRVLEAVRAKTCLVDDEVSNVLGVLNSSSRVVNSLVTLALCGMNTELHLVDAVAETKDRHVGALNS